MVRNGRISGFVLVPVIMAIALVGMIMYILADGAKTMMFQSDSAYLEACRRNLAASGLAWARQTIKEQRTANYSKPVTLNVDKLNIRNGSLSVQITTSADQKQAQISSTASRANRTMSYRSTYLLD